MITSEVSLLLNTLKIKLIISEPFPKGKLVHQTTSLRNIQDTSFSFLSSRLMKEEMSPVLGEWRSSRGFDKGAIKVTHKYKN